MTELLDRQLTGFERGAGLASSTARFDGPLDILCGLDYRTVRTPALEIVSRTIAEAERTPDARVIITMPPQEGKSSTATRAGVLYMLHKNPTRRIVVASYADRIARRFGRRIRNDITGGPLPLGLALAPDQKAADEWELTTGGGVYTAGVGGALTSRSADAMVIDDPLKGRKDADSQIVRDDVWEWWESTASSRLSPGAPVILILTRWHYDDLAGRLMREQPGVWTLVHIPAQADPALVDPDPLDRAPGEFMLSARGRSAEQWEARKRDAGDEWGSLYQGDPAAPGGEVFHMDGLRYWHPSRDGLEIIAGTRAFKVRECWRFVTMDTATSTRTSADFTVASCWAVAGDGSLILLGVARDRVPPERQLELARPLVERWQPETVYVEPSLRSTLLAREAVLAGWNLTDLKPDASKEVRAAPAARRVREGRVWFPSEMPPLGNGAPALDTLLTELRQFPNGRHDDFVDTLAYAALVQTMHYVPPGAGQPPTTPTPADPLSAVLAPPVDYDRQQW